MLSRLPWRPLGEQRAQADGQQRPQGRSVPGRKITAATARYISVLATANAKLPATLSLTKIGLTFAQIEDVSGLRLD